MDDELVYVVCEICEKRRSVRQRYAWNTKYCEECAQEMRNKQLEEYNQGSRIGRCEKPKPWVVLSDPDKNGGFREGVEFRNIEMKYMLNLQALTLYTRLRLKSDVKLKGLKLEKGYYRVERNNGSMVVKRSNDW